MNERKVLVYQNGDLQDRKSKPLTLVQGLTVKQLIEQIRLAFNCRQKQLRLFNHEGVELFQEDLPYVKDGQVLYFSKGQEFDARSSFVEYEIVKKLGEGGFGSVMLGIHKRTGEKVAIKIVNARAIGNAEMIDMVFREAEMLKSLRHRNIVKIHNCFTLPNMEVVFVMEYLEGGELLEYVVKKGQLEEGEAAHYFIQIAEAIQYCHQMNLIHRDLKLENILLSDATSRTVKVVDFGIAGLANNFNISKVDIGTLRYMPPEILNGNAKEIGPSIDIWALGIILFGLVCGRLPFDGETAEETVQSIVKVAYQFPIGNNLTHELKDLLSRIFISFPQKRIKLNQILEHPWIKMHLDIESSHAKGRYQKNQQFFNQYLVKSEDQTSKRRATIKKKVNILNETDQVEQPTIVNIKERAASQNSQYAQDQQKRKIYKPNYKLPSLRFSRDIQQAQRELNQKKRILGTLLLPKIQPRSTSQYIK